MARTSSLDKFPELRDFVALCYHKGMSNEAIAEAVNKEWEALETHKDTIIRWRKDDQIQSKIHRLARERITRILRVTDNELMRRLEKMAHEMDTDELLKVRKEFVPQVDALTDEKTDKAGIVKDIFGAAREDPNLAQEMVDAAKAARGDGN